MVIKGDFIAAEEPDSLTMNEFPRGHLEIFSHIETEGDRKTCFDTDDRA